MLAFFNESPSELLQALISKLPGGVRDRGERGSGRRGGAFVRQAVARGNRDRRATRRFP
jgi:hypothetical protein